MIFPNFNDISTFSHGQCSRDVFMASTWYLYNRNVASFSVSFKNLNTFLNASGNSTKSRACKQ